MEFRRIKKGIREEILNKTLVYFPYLIDDYGFVIESEGYFPKSFGNFFIILLGKHFQVRFECDRMQITIDVGPVNEPDNWYDLRIVLEFLNQENGIKYSEIKPGEMEELSRVFKDNYEKIQNLFKEENFPRLKNSLEQYRTALVERRLGIKRNS